MAQSTFNPLLSLSQAVEFRGVDKMSTFNPLLSLSGLDTKILELWKIFQSSSEFKRFVEKRSIIFLVCFQSSSEFKLAQKELNFLIYYFQSSSEFKKPANCPNSLCFSAHFQSSSEFK